jgi:YesN/AraC family two-component response regulator
MEPEMNSVSPVTILIVEDDCNAVDLLRSMLARRFSSAVTLMADRGESALMLCRERLPDIVVTDIDMPGMDGITMAEEIRRLNPAVEIILMTGYNDRGYLQRIRSLGIRDYLLKPVDLKKLFECIDSCIGQLGGRGARRTDT